VLPVHAGPTHAYIGASAACWALYARLSTSPYEQRQGTRLRRLAEHAYAAQHPGVPQRRSAQSVAVHLMGLCVLLERDARPIELEAARDRVPPRKAPSLRWLTPPPCNGRLTVADVLAAGPDEGLAPSVEAWAGDVWAAWEGHHATVRRWLRAPVAP
jgi:hypothetical protein